jgi:hypothetical protein
MRLRNSGIVRGRTDAGWCDATGREAFAAEITIRLFVSFPHHH